MPDLNLELVNGLNARLNSLSKDNTTLKTHSLQLYNHISSIVEKANHKSNEKKREMHERELSVSLEISKDNVTKMSMELLSSLDEIVSSTRDFQLIELENDGLKDVIGNHSYSQLINHVFNLLSPKRSRETSLENKRDYLNCRLLLTVSFL